MNHPPRSLMLSSAQLEVETIPTRPAPHDLSRNLAFARVGHTDGCATSGNAEIRIDTKERLAAQSVRARVRVSTYVTQLSTRPYRSSESTERHSERKTREFIAIRIDRDRERKVMESYGTNIRRTMNAYTYVYVLIHLPRCTVCMKHDQ